MAYSDGDQQHADQVARFEGTPWAAQLLRDSNWRTIRTGSRRRRAPTENTFMGETLKTENTIRSCVILMRETELPEEIVMLLELGGGLNGFPQVCHGGFVATLLDEVTGVMMVERKKAAKNRLPSMTGYLNVNYHKPVRTPGIILARANAVRSEGRKVWVNGSIEDGQGTVLSSCEAMFIEVRGKM